MFYELNQYISNSLTEVFQPSVGQRVKYTANTKGTGITTANSSLTTGTVGTDIFLIMTGASNGTLVKTVNIKATGSTVRGMVRLFVADSPTSPTYFELITEIDIPECTLVAVSATGYGTVPSFATAIQADFMLQSGMALFVTGTNTGFTVIAEGLDTTFP